MAGARFSVANLGNLDRIRHDQGLADGGFSVTNLGNHFHIFFHHFRFLVHCQGTIVRAKTDEEQPKISRMLHPISCT